MRKTHPNLIYVPATKDKKGREGPAHRQIEITINDKRVSGSIPSRQRRSE